MPVQYLANLSLFVPELVLVVTMVGVLFLESSYREKEGSHHYIFALTMLGLVAAAASSLANLGVAPTEFFTKSLVHDSFSALAKFLMILATIFCVYLGYQSSEIEDDLKSEFSAMSLGVLIGGMLLASSNNMLTLYLGIETLSILSYALAAMKKRDEKSAEAGLKYVLYGGVTAGLMLFGISHIFGVLGTINFSEINSAVGKVNEGQLAVLIPAFILFFAGIGYKIACVPFHMWSPDVYEGSPTPVTAFFALVPKIAGITVLLRITFSFFDTQPVLHHTWLALLSTIAALTLTIGNVTAIGQRSVKRMLAFSSISHVGMIILGVIVGGDEGPRSVMFYLMTYLFMTVVAFYIVALVSEQYGNDYFERFNGLIYRHPLMAILLSIVMFSLAGIPPLSGFVAKFNILAVVLQKKFYFLALLAALNSVVSLYYYLKVVRLMIFKESEGTTPIRGFGFLNQAIISIASVPVVLLGIYWENVLLWAQGAKLFVP